MNPNFKNRVFKWSAIGAVSWGLLGIAGAATYNLYFNNTEQGDNSTATPSLSVATDGAGKLEVKKNGETAATAPETPLPTPQTTIPPQPTILPPPMIQAAPGSAQSVASVFTAPNTDHKWRASVVGGVFAEGYFDGASIGANLGYFPLSYLGFNAFVGGLDTSFHGGAELELTPFKLNVFGFQDTLEVGAMIGLNSLAAASSNFVSAHIGARAAWNFGSRWMVTTQVRGNLGFITADAGLGYRF